MHNFKQSQPFTNPPIQLCMFYILYKEGHGTFTRFDFEVKEKGKVERSFDTAPRKRGEKKKAGQGKSYIMKENATKKTFGYYFFIFS